MRRIAMLMCRKRYIRLVNICAVFLVVISARVHGVCEHPAVGLNSRVLVNSLDTSAVAEYSCDPGFVRIGESSRVCKSDGSWTGTPPVCATNVALGKPSNQSSVARGGASGHANDGDLSTLHDGRRCSETVQQLSPWWMVDLLNVYPIDMIRVTTRGCCGQQPLQDIEIRVGDSDSLQQNRLCAWYPATLQDGESRDFHCARAMSGRYVFIQMVGVEGAMSLCEVQVFSSHEFAKEQCAQNIPLSSLGLYNKHCYQFKLDSGANYVAARENCRQHGGDLVHSLSDPVFDYLLTQLELQRSSMTTQLLWIGVTKQQRQQRQRDDSDDSAIWTWVNGSVVSRTRWGADQPNSYVGQQNCVVLDGGRQWLWNDVSCRLDYLHWICEYTPQVCGSPDKLEGTRIQGNEFSVNSSIVYQCPLGHKVVGDQIRTCDRTGLWSGSAPTCQFVDCDALPAIARGHVALLDNRTTYGARAEYTCHENYTLTGAILRTCEDGVWSDKQPRCLLALCESPPPPVNGSVLLLLPDGSDRPLTATVPVDATLRFSCRSGHKLDGSQQISCQLGGDWSGTAPRCRLVDCGRPAAISGGSVELINGSTLYGASAAVQCDEHHSLHGASVLKCLDNGSWSGPQPQCHKISCGEPEVPAASYVTGYDFHVHSVIEYHCESGHLLQGPANRTCLPDGAWSLHTPTCKYVDCGRAMPILHGDVHYLGVSAASATGASAAAETGAVGGRPSVSPAAAVAARRTTHLDAELRYSCRKHYRLVGESVRVCLPSALWSRQAPVCQEIRCNRPQQAPNSVLSVSHNDMMRQKARQILQNLPPTIDTFRIGATVTYRCQPGYKVVGDALRTCVDPGQWSGAVPRCQYVDCGPPSSVSSHTNISLISHGATHYGALAEYTCAAGYRLAPGAARRRICLGNSTWSGAPSSCIEVLCERPEQAALSSAGLLVSVEGVRVGDRLTYSCSVAGMRLVGASVRECQPSGLWNGTAPVCQVVDCGRVMAVEHGRVYHVNESTVFDSLVEYHCLPGHVRRGPFSRRCRHDGAWSGPDTKCISIEEAGRLSEDGVTVGGDPLDTDTAGGHAGRTAREAARITLIWSSLAIALFLVIGLATVIVCLKLRRVAVKNTENVEGMKAMEERRVPIMSFNSLDGGRRFQNADARLQNRPLPSRPGLDDDDDIYAEADSFSSHGSSEECVPCHGADTPGLSHDTATYINSGSSVAVSGGPVSDGRVSAADTASTEAASYSNTNANAHTITVNGIAL